MPTSFYQYEMLPTTWFYVSALIVLATFFKFNRFFSIRNLDLVGLTLFTPGLLLLAMRDDRSGYDWLFLIGLFMVVRLIFDTVMVRRPLLEPNLTPGGLTFACFVLFGFLLASITFNRADRVETLRTVRLEQILTVRGDRATDHVVENATAPAPRFDNHEKTVSIPPEPGFVPFRVFVDMANRALLPALKVRQEILDGFLPGAESDSLNKTPREQSDALRATDHTATSPVSSPGVFTEVPGVGSPMRIPPAVPISPSALPVSPTPRPTELLTVPAPAVSQPNAESRPSTPLLFVVILLAMSAQLMILLGFVYIGHCHFGNIRVGIACTMLYLLLPYTNQVIGRLDHSLPAALIVWAIAMYRRPFFAGVWIGLAAALVYYPIFLVPLWWSFYWKRGWIRFVVGVGAMFLLALLVLPAFPEGRETFWAGLLRSCGDSAFFMVRPDGFWDVANAIYRVPVVAAFLVVCFGLVLWPAHKHLGTLLCCTALVMLGVQFWQPHEGGLCMAWYLPALILTIFRPNLEDRTAHAVVVE